MERWRAWSVYARRNHRLLTQVPCESLRQNKGERGANDAFQPLLAEKEEDRNQPAASPPEEIDSGEEKEKQDEPSLQQMP